MTKHGYYDPNLGADYSDEELEFLKAIDRYQRKLGRRLDARDALKVAHDLGYRRERATGD
jgi:hypothetical protein